MENIEEKKKKLSSIIKNMEQKLIGNSDLTERGAAYQSVLRVYEALLRRPDINIDEDINNVIVNAENALQVMGGGGHAQTVARGGGGKRRRKSKKVKKSRMGQFPHKRKSKKVRKLRTKKFPHKRR